MTRVGRAGWVRLVATWLLLGGSVLAAAAFTVDRLASASDGGGIGFYDEAWSDDGVRVTSLDPGAAGPDGLEVDDLVRSIDGTTMDEWLALAVDPAQCDRTASMSHTSSIGAARRSARRSRGANPMSARPSGQHGPSGSCRSPSRPSPRTCSRNVPTCRSPRRWSSEPSESRKQRAVGTGHDDQRDRHGRSVHPPGGVDRRSVHAHLAGGHPHGARLSAATRRGGAISVAHPGGVCRRPRWLWAGPGGESRCVQPAGLQSEPGRASSWRSPSPALPPSSACSLAVSKRGRARGAASEPLGRRRRAAERGPRPGALPGARTRPRTVAPARKLDRPRRPAHPDWASRSPSCAINLFGIDVVVNRTLVYGMLTTGVLRNLPRC